MKKGYYGTYGSNAAAIFDNWEAVMKSKPMFIGFKNKKFDNVFSALEYVIDGIDSRYHISNRDKANICMLKYNVNKVVDIEELISIEKLTGINQVPWDIKISEGET